MNLRRKIFTYLSHVPNGEPSEGRVLAEGLNAHGLAGDQGHDGSVTRLDEFGVRLGRLTSTPVNLKKKVLID